MMRKEIDFSAYYDKVLGAWKGKSLGGLFGSPYETHKVHGGVTTENCKPQILYPNDDLDIQLVWLELLEDRGADFTHMDLANAWRDRCWYNFCEYSYFLYNLQRGVEPPATGSFNNEFFSQSMGCPIRSEIWALAVPGNPGAAARLAWMDGTLDHERNAVWAEQFWAAAQSAAFFTGELEEMLEAGRRVLPQDCAVLDISREVPRLWRESGDPEAVWKWIMRRYGRRDTTSVFQNFAFTLLALLAGGGDFKRTIVAALNCAYDADCTAATAGALLGVWKGTACLPADWLEILGDSLICDINVRHRLADYHSLAVDTALAAAEVSPRFGGAAITGLPAHLAIKLRERTAGRAPAPLLSFSVSYPEEPALFARKDTPVVLHLHYRGERAQRVELRAEAPQGVSISPARAVLVLGPRSETQLLLSCRAVGELVRDKNILRVEAALEEGGVFPYAFGLAGSRQWLVYGPYWDGWDTKRFHGPCPYRNAHITNKAHKIPGCEDVARQNYVRGDRAYLDETALFQGELPEELPFVVESGPDRVTTEDLGGFQGQCCYYLVRELWAGEDTDCALALGSTAPFTVYLDGEEVLSSPLGLPWSPYDFVGRVRLKKGLTRAVVKLVNENDWLEFSMAVFHPHGYFDNTPPASKAGGVSVLMDALGDRVRRE